MTGRLEVTDIGKVIAVPLRGIVTDGEPFKSPQERIAVKLRHDLVGRHVNAVSATWTEVSDILNGIENTLWVILAGKHGNGDRAANIRRYGIQDGLHRRMPRLRRPGSSRPPCRTGRHRASQ